MTKVKEMPKKVVKPTQDEVDLSKEELAKRRVEVTKYYKENITHLKVQLQYEELLRDIEKVRAERVQAQMFLAQAMAEPPQEEQMPTKQEAQEFMREQQEFYGSDIPENKRTLKRPE